MLPQPNTLLNMPLVWTANDFFPGLYFAPDLGDVQAPSRVTLTSAVMKTQSLCSEEPPLLSAGHSHQGQTRGLKVGLKNVPLLWANAYREAHYWNPIQATRPVTKYSVAALLKLDVQKPTQNKEQNSQPIHKQASLLLKKVLQYVYFRQFYLCTRNTVPPIDKHLSIIILFWIAK